MFYLVPEENVIGEIASIVALPKPAKYTVQNTFPFNELSDTQFEMLLYLAAKGNIGNNFLSIPFDSCRLLGSSGDKGRDVILKRDGKHVGVIQCKKYKSNLDKGLTLKEILKFVIYYMEDRSLIPDLTDFRYYMAASTGFTKDAADLLDNFADNIAAEVSNIEKFAKEIIQEYKTIKNTYELIFHQLMQTLSMFRVERIVPPDITSAIINKPEIVKMFFTVDSVIDKEAFLQIINGGILDVRRFTSEYATGVINNYSRINFFGLALSRKPREVHLNSLFVYPILRHQRSSAHQFGQLAFSDIIGEHPKAVIETLGKYLIGSQDMPDLIVKSANDVLTLAEFKSSQHEKNPMENSNLWQHYFQYFAQYNNVTFGMDVRKEDYIDFKDIFDGSRNLVILGDAGAGKSSLIKYAMCKLVERDTTVFTSEGIYNRIPFHIELSKYNEYKRTVNEGLTGYMNALLETDHQLTFTSKNSIAKLLDSYDTLIFFDGLDEIIDVQERIKIRNEIETFCNNHIKTRAIVTSRLEAYEEVYFKEKDFDVYEISALNDRQIGDYINKWYTIEEADELIRKKEIVSCLRALASVEDELKRNPLLLSLILIIYRNALDFPTTKLDVYESCTNTLVEVRDAKEKKLPFALKISNKIAAFSALAFWQYKHLSSHNKKSLGYQDVVTFLTNYLIEKTEFNDNSEAERAAHEFLDFARLRSIYVQNYFTHKTFLEYFTAYYVFANYHAKGKFTERDQLIEQIILDPAWYIVLELLICKIDRDQPDYDVIDQIIESQTKKNLVHSTTFFIQIIKYLRNASPRMKSVLIANALEICIGIIKTKDTNIMKTINSSLQSLSESSETASILSKKLAAIYDDTSGIIRMKYVSFILENAIQRPTFAQFLPTDYAEISSEDPYLFLLTYYPEFSDWDAYVKRLEQFIQRFKLRTAIESFYAKYVYNIFAGSNRFHWVITPLFSSPDFKSFMNRFRTFIRLGVTFNHIQKAIHEDSGTIGLSFNHLIEFYDEAKGLQMKTILSDALKKYYRWSTLDEKQKVPFFEKGYNPRRKFQIPK